MAVRPQKALETAVLNLLRNRMGLLPADSGRSYKGQPPPRAGNWYVSVHHDGGRKAGPSRKTAHDVVYSVSVTVTRRFVQPFDRIVEHYDELEEKVEAIAAAVGADVRDFRVCNAANEIAGYRDAGTPDGTHVVGFCEPLVYDGTDDVIEQGPDWWHAELDKATYRECGLSQRVRFSGARHVQNWANAE